MPKAQDPPSRNVLSPRLRVWHGAEIALGPGKADLMAAIAAQGSLAGAARQLGMSYMRAWKLVQTLNACFREPLVETSRGGSRHGQAGLTPAGREVLALYQRMEEDCRRAAEPAFRELLERHLLE